MLAGRVARSSDRATESAFCDLLGFVMTGATSESDEIARLLNAVAPLRDLPEHGLVRGQVGTVVETLDETTALVEFSDDQGRPYAIAP